jgi:ssDNA-binding Zn-finger/Zn-ribbon topoisomerase 1
MAYLNCPTCRLTVYRSVSTLTEECPRCRARLGKASRLFSSQLPPRLQKRGSKQRPAS